MLLRSKRIFAWATTVLVALVVACGADDGSDRTPTYHQDVEPIVVDHCVNCHRAGDIAPFSLETYADTKAHGAAIKRATAERTMPPFNLDNSGACQTYAHARWLDDASIATLGAWVDHGMPEGEGDGQSPKPPPAQALDRVDLTIDMGTSYTPNASAEDDYRCFVIDPKLTEDRYITAFQIRYGEARMVHHLTLFAFDTEEDEKEAERLDDEDAVPGYSCFGDTRAPSRWLVGSGPGGGAVFFPQGTGLLMGKGRKTVLQMHYNRRNGTFADRTKIDLTLAKKVDRAAFVPRLADTNLNLPPRQAAVSQSESITMNEQSTLWGIWPHMHNLGSQLRVTGTTFDGTQECIAQVNRWQFHWQGFEQYQKPIVVYPGETLRITCTYDTLGRDTATTWGQGTNDEMCIAFFYVTQP